jgi:hypothetical protein
LLAHLVVLFIYLFICYLLLLLYRREAKCANKQIST